MIMDIVLNNKRFIGQGWQCKKSDFEVENDLQSEDFLKNLNVFKELFWEYLLYKEHTDGLGRQIHLFVIVCWYIYRPV